MDRRLRPLAAEPLVSAADPSPVPTRRLVLAAALDASEGAIEVDPGAASPPISLAVAAERARRSITTSLLWSRRERSTSASQPAARSTSSATRRSASVAASEAATDRDSRGGDHAHSGRRSAVLGDCRRRARFDVRLRWCRSARRWHGALRRRGGARRKRDRGWPFRREHHRREAHLLGTARQRLRQQRDGDHRTRNRSGRRDPVRWQGRRRWRRLLEPDLFLRHGGPRSCAPEPGWRVGLELRRRWRRPYGGDHAGTCSRVGPGGKDRRGRRHPRRQRLQADGPRAHQPRWPELRSSFGKAASTSSHSARTPSRRGSQCSRTGRS